MIGPQNAKVACVISYCGCYPKTKNQMNFHFSRTKNTSNIRTLGYLQMRLKIETFKKRMWLSTFFAVNALLKICDKEFLINFNFISMIVTSNFDDIRKWFSKYLVLQPSKESNAYYVINTK